MKKILIILIIAFLSSGCVGSEFHNRHIVKKNQGNITEKFITHHSNGKPRFFIVTTKAVFSMGATKYAEYKIGDEYFDTDFNKYTKN